MPKHPPEMFLDVAAALDPPLYRSFVANRFGVKLKSSTFFKVKRMISEPHDLKQPPDVFYKKLFLKILQYSLKNTCVGVSF